jgi:hypothetical protein
VRRHHKTAHPDGTAVPAGAQKSPPVSLHVTQTTGSVTRFPVRQGIVVGGAAGFTRLLADRRGGWITLCDWSVAARYGTVCPT